MARVVVSLEDVRGTTATEVVWQTDYSGYTLWGPLGDAANANVSVWAGATRYIVRFRIRSTGGNELFVQTASTPVAFGANGQDLPASWEDGADAIQISCPGVDDLILPGPNYSGNRIQDSGEQYSWDPSVARRAEIGDWITAFRALPVAERNATLTLDDGQGTAHTATASPASWAFNLPEASATKTEPDPIEHTATASPVNWTFDLPEASATKTAPPDSALTLSDWSLPAGRVQEAAALITAGNELYRAGVEGSLDDGELTLDNADITINRIRRLRSFPDLQLILNRSGTAPWDSILEGTMPPYADVQIHLQYGDQPGEIIVLDIDDLNDAGSGFAQFVVPLADESAFEGIADGDTFILAVTRKALVAYSQGLTVAIGNVTTKPLTGSLDLSRSLADGSSLRLRVQGSLSNLGHIRRSAIVTATDVDSDTLAFAGHILKADVTSIGPGDLVEIAVKATGNEQRLYKRILSAADARRINVAASTSEQLDELVTIAGSEYSAGAVPTDANMLSGVGPGVTAGALLRGMADAQSITPGGLITLIVRPDLVATAEVTIDHARPTSSYSADLDTAVGRVVANGAAVRFISTGTLKPVTEGGVTVTAASVSAPADTEIQVVDKVIARAAIVDKFDVGDELDGVWDPDNNRFEWSGVLDVRQPALVELHGTWRTETIVTATSPDALARDLVLDVPLTSTTAITAAANKALARQRQPVELMNLDTVLGANLPRLVPGDAVTVALALQEDLDVYQAVAADLWLVHGVKLTQKAAEQVSVRLLLSRRLPDYRERDYWSRAEMGGSGGRQIVIGSGGGAPQIAQVIPVQSVVVGGEAVDIDLGDYFSDPDGDMLTYAAVSSDESKATVAIAGETLTITPVAEGSTTVTVTASDPSRSAAQQVAVTVVTNRSPVIDAQIPDSAALRQPVTYALEDYFSDPDGDALTYAVASTDDGKASAVLAGGILTIRPVAEGVNTVTVTASDGIATVSQDVDITVPALNSTTLDLEADVYDWGTSRAEWDYDYDTGPGIPAVLMGVTFIVRLGSVQAYESGRLRLNTDNGRRFSDAVELYGLFTLEADGNTLEFAIAGAARRAPYSWTPANADEVTAFYNALPDDDGNVSATLTIRDYTP